MWKFNLKSGKERWLFLLAVGMIILILSFPAGNKKKPVVPQVTTEAAAGQSSNGKYEEELEKRVKKVLRNVDGVGEVDVMIVLKSSEEKVYRVDKSITSSLVEEADSSGGTRKTDEHEESQNTVLTGGGSANAPVLEKELKPEIAGIIISAQGGGSPTVKSEISAAMEALFDVPPHKIKVLKRVD
ncbi:stage III sporulation protein AG [Clostridium sp. chh4-2]|uniref:stage III sporulation protein AG n=1 Tax=Clostridium sp. chh4-2 TaxID=2067550 RepID=UPI002699CE06